MGKMSKTKAQLVQQINSWHDDVDLCKDATLPIVIHVKRNYSKASFKNKQLPVHPRPVKFSAVPPICSVTPVAQIDPLYFATESMHMLGLECESDFL